MRPEGIQISFQNKLSPLISLYRYIQNSLCTRAPVSIKQSQTYLKKVKLYKNVEVQHLTDENIVAGFTRLIKARPTKVINLMILNKLKPKVKRKRNEKMTARKKPRLDTVGPEAATTETGKDIHVKTETTT